MLPSDKPTPDATRSGMFCAVRKLIGPDGLAHEPESPENSSGLYDPFAWIYNQDWGEDYHRQIDAVLELLLYPYLPARASVLDLCCGGGHVTQLVAARGYRITGIDGSEEMLRYARERVPEGRFLCADARNFTLEPRVDAVLSTYDSLNHIMSVAELEQVFACVREALQPGGRFLFDMNDDDAYTEPWTHIGSSPDRTRHWVANGACDPVSRVARCEIEEMWRVDGEWQRRTFLLDQRCYSTAEVLGALTAAGFRECRAQPAAELGMRRATAEGRVFYSALA